MGDASPRTTAALVVDQVVREGRSLTTALPPTLPRLAPRDRGLAQELCYGTLRWHPRLEFVLKRLLQKPLKARDQDLHALLLVGLYQLAYLAVPPHVAVSETVSAAELMGKGWAKGLVNGILRRFQREAAQLGAEADGDVAARFAHPRWLLEMLQRAWPDAWEPIAEANNARAPLTLRVNAVRLSREDYLGRLHTAGISAHPAPHVSAAVIVEHAVPVEQLPGFGEGLVSVQDAAAQLAAELLDPQPGEHVLDACAAPGGKTSHLLERAPDLALDALDRDAARLVRVRENLSRLGLNARVIAADAGETEPWWDGRPYDRILLDAPCSATGVIRRHPDIKSLRKAADIPGLVTEQARLLNALWPLLKPGGMLLYATCSILPEENAGQIRRFIAAHADAVERPIAAEWGRPMEAGRQILPGENDMDGFYYACIAKA
jgi:16S rRNA (cytosine967-C5)-methyltransferase